jgi:hypothetical protein
VHTNKKGDASLKSIIITNDFLETAPYKNSSKIESKA